MNARSTFRLGIAFAVGSALTFGMSGPFAKALMAAGWTPNAAVTARLAGGAQVMAVFATLVHRGWGEDHNRAGHGRAVVLLGLALAGREDREPADVIAWASWPDAGPVTVDGPHPEEAVGLR